MKGELAEAFGALLEQLWRGGLSAVTPRSFKAKIGRFAPQFSGYAQHDSQEFLAFLLDGLHEDTNRIQKKPYIEVHTHNCIVPASGIPQHPSHWPALAMFISYKSFAHSLCMLPACCGVLYTCLHG